LKERFMVTVRMLSTGWLIALLTSVSGVAMAKFPPLTEEARAKAAETAARTGWSDKVAAFQLCKSQDRVAAKYVADAKAAAKEVKPAVATPACADPGAFAYTPAAPRPLEAAGAHSPPGTAATPPSTAATQSQISGGVKK
jgi:phage protein D